MELTVKIEDYKLKTEQLKQLYIDCAKYYCDDGTKIPSDDFGKKMYDCILFLSNTEKTYKMIVVQRAKE